MHLLTQAAVPEETVGVGTLMGRLGLVLLLVLLNAFFVAAEFALVAARRSRLEQMAGEGDRTARLAVEVMSHLDRYISGTQLGVTLASLGLGWLGEPALAELVDRGLERLGITASSAATHTTAAVITGFLVITFLHIVLGELTPKSVAIVAPETVARWLVRPLVLFSRVTSPFIWLLNRSANGLLRTFGLQAMSEAQQVHSPEELRLLVMQARAHGTLNESDSAMLAGVFDFHEKRAHDVMIPRTEVIAIDIETTNEEILETVRRERFSRYPVYRESLDDVVGVFIAKDLLLHDRSQPFSLASAMRQPLYVPATRPAERVLDDLRKTRAQMAVVLDEYGGTAGILTMEDLIEEVVGDIADEYDIAARTAIEANGVLELAGSLSLIDVRSDYSLRIPEGDWTTLGGYTFSALGRLPRVGDRVPFPDGELEVVAMDGRRVAAVRVLRTANQS